MRVIVDTSVWSLALRRAAEDLDAGQRALRLELTDLIRDGRVCMLGPIRQEILSGIRERSVFEKLRTHLRAFPDELLATDDYEAAAEIGNRCRKAGVSGSAPDYLICAVAIRRGFAVLTTDRDFQQYARHTPLQLYPARKK